MVEKAAMCGRLYPKNYSFGCAATVSRAVRGALYSDTYVEIDLQACHPAVLADLARQYGYQICGVETYLQNRSILLDKGARAFDRSKDSIKRFYNAAVYGCKRRTVVGNDGKKRSIDDPFDQSTLPPGVAMEDAEEARLSMKGYLDDVQNIAYGQLLRDPRVIADNAPNIRDWEKSSRKMFRLLEVGERRNIEALLQVIDESGGAWEHAEIIFDGVLVRHSAGGEPNKWDLGELCARAERRAQQLFGQNPKCAVCEDRARAAGYNMRLNMV